MNKEEDHRIKETDKSLTPVLRRHKLNLGVKNKFWGEAN